MDLLPKIKCSTCGVEIDILQLADHVCAANTTTTASATSATTAPSVPDVPAPPPLDRAAGFGNTSFNNRLADEPRPARMPPPPRIDSDVANKPFLSPGLLPSAGLARSPPSSDYEASPYPVSRGMPSPAARPPSDLTPNMDNPFPPWPSRKNKTPTGSKPQSRERLDPYNQRYAQPSPLFAPVSPRTNGGESIMKRMNTIAPGPFDGRRPSTSGSNGPQTPARETQPLGHRRTNTQGSTNSVNFAHKRTGSVASVGSRASRKSNSSIGLPSRPKDGMGGNAALLPPPPPPPPAERQPEGIDAFLQRLQEETMRPSKISQDSRSKTFPVRKESGDRPANAPEPKNLQRRPTDLEPTKAAPRSNNAFPPRSSSRSRDESQTTRLRAELPPLPPVPSYARENNGEQIYTPSDSGHSEDSYASSGFRSAASSRSSPPASEGPHSREASKVGRTDYLAEEPMRRTYSPEPFSDPRPAPLVPENRRNMNPPQERFPEPRQDSGYPPSPPRDRRRDESSVRGRRQPDELHMDTRSAPSPPRDRSRNESSTRGRAPEPRPQPPYNSSFLTNNGLPLDPAIQLGLPLDSPLDPALKFAHVLPPASPSPSSTLASPAPPARRPTTGPRAKCRGCAQPIVGKSVKDSSGRLTGRYHKECFTCRTCAASFPTAEFYVFDNFPYCEFHYHRLNDSLCTSCGSGIEGQYLETENRAKFHPRCFTCATCRIVLRDDYYEVAGRNFCERHVGNAVGGRGFEQQGGMLGVGGGRDGNVQKRRTRLMMMV